MLLSGRVQNDNYTNRNGEKVYSVQIIADDIEFAESKNSSANNAGGFQAGGFQDGGRPEPSQAVGDGFMNIPDGIDEELPFN